MDNISKIIDAITAEAQEYADRTIAQAKVDSDSAINLHRKEAELNASDIIAAGEAKASEYNQRSVSQAGIEGRNIRLAAKREALSKAFDAALDKLAAMDIADRKSMYEKLISRCGVKDAVIVLNEQDKVALGDKLSVDGVNITISDETGNFAGGLVVKEETTEINCTFETLVDSARTDMESEIAAMLFS